MSAPQASNILHLYKNLLRYGQQLQFTNKEYFLKRIKTEFKNNKNLERPSDILHEYQKGLALLERRSVV